MAVMDEFREEREAIKNAPFKGKFEYYWEYYSKTVFGILVAVACIISIIVSIVSKPEYVLNGYIMNRYWLMDEESDCKSFVDEYMKYRGHDTDKYAMSVNGTLRYVVTDEDEELVESTLYTAQLVGAQCAAGEVDFMVADYVTVEEFDGAAYFKDLREIYSEDELKKYEDLLVYSVNDSAMPIAIDVTESQKLQEIYGITHDKLVIGFFGNAEHTEEGKYFVEYILQNE